MNVDVQHAIMPLADFRHHFLVPAGCPSTGNSWYDYMRGLHRPLPSHAIALPQDTYAAVMAMPDVLCGEPVWVDCIRTLHRKRGLARRAGSRPHPAFVEYRETHYASYLGCVSRDRALLARFRLPLPD